MRTVPNNRLALDPVIWKRLVQRRSKCTNVTPERPPYTTFMLQNRNRNFSNGRMWNRLEFQSTSTCNPFRLFSSVSDTTQGSNHTKEDEKEPPLNEQNIIVMDDFPYQEIAGDDGDEDMDSDDDDEDGMDSEELAQSAPQHLQSYVEKQEELITKYVNISSSHLDNYTIDVNEAEEI